MLLPIYLFPLVLLVHIYIPALSLFSCKIIFLSNCAFSYTFTGLGRLEQKALLLFSSFFYFLNLFLNHFNHKT